MSSNYLVLRLYCRNQVLANVAPIDSSFVAAFNAQDVPPPVTNETENREANISLLLNKLEIDKLDYMSTAQKEHVKKLISKYSHIFSQDDDDIGCSTLPEHTIILDTDKPIRAKYRPIPVT